MTLLYILLYFLVGSPISFIAVTRDDIYYWPKNPEELAQDFWEFLLIWLIMTVFWPIMFIDMVWNKISDVFPRFINRLLTFLNRYTGGFRLWFAKEILRTKNGKSSI